MAIVIVGAGIGGLTAALSLHAVGETNIVVLEAAPEIRDLGVGVNLPPHAVRELTELGLADALARVGVLTKELSYYDPAGKLIWAEPRGLEAGYRWPQYSIHRGKLQRLLLDAVRERLGEGAIRTGHRVTDVRPEGGAVTLEAHDLATERTVSYAAELTVVADGIRSALRDQLYGRATPLASNGWVMHRGTTRAAPFLTGQTMVIIGDETQRIVVYPIEPGVLNWLAVRPKDAGRDAVELGNWNVPIAPSQVASFVQDYRFDWLDVPALVAAATEAYEYPMADIDPLPHWVFGRCALLGDAAHAMYPFGSNGASQAILDARVLAYEVVTQNSIDAALQAYESQRRPVTAEVQLANRRQAGNVMAKVSEMARRGGHSDAASELQEVERRYKQLAGFEVETLNNRKSWSVSPAQRRSA